MYQSHVVPGAFSHVAQAVALFVAPLGAWKDPLVKRALNVGIAFALLSFAAMSPAFISFGLTGRFTLALDIVANVWLWLATFALLRQASTTWLQGFSRLCWLMAIGSLIQAAVHPVVVASDSSRFAGIPRPLFTFSEPTWLGVSTALLIATLLTLQRNGRLVALLACVNIFVLTRSALVVLASALYTAIRRGRAMLDSAILIIAVMAGATYFTITALVAPLNIRYVGTSLDTRLGDVTAVRLANNNDLLPFGGANLSVFDPSRSRWVPTTSNNLVFDLLWKFGIGGVILFLLWIVMLVSGFPRIVGARIREFLRLPAGVALLLLPAVAQINNLFREPWSWTLMAVLLAAIKIRLDQNACQDENARLSEGG